MGWSPRILISQLRNYFESFVNFIQLFRGTEFALGLSPTLG